jgi:hypothetical protein
MEVTQTVTSNKDSIPAHYVALSSYGCHKGNTEQKASAEYKLLYRAWKNELLGGIKFMANPHDKHGKIFVDPADADRVIDSAAKPAPAISVLSPNLSGDSVSINAALSMAEMRLTLSRIESILERLAVAAESIATQPHEPAGSWRDMNGDVMN